MTDLFERFFCSADERYLRLTQHLLEDMYVTENDLWTGPWLAGGTLRRLYEGQPFTGADFDFFFHDEESREDFNSRLVIDLNGSQQFETHNSTTFKVAFYDWDITVQTVKQFYYSNPEQVISSFDFSCVQFATNGSEVVYDIHAIQDIKSKILRPCVHGLKSGSATLRRIAKFAAEGYELSYSDSTDIIDWYKQNPKMFEKLSPGGSDHGDMPPPKEPAATVRKYDDFLS